MTYRGHVVNGQIVLDQPAQLPEGATVTVEVDAPRDITSPPAIQGTLHDRLKPYIGAIKDLPPDFSRRHDYYIHGTPEE